MKSKWGVSIAIGGRQQLHQRMWYCSEGRTAARMSQLTLHFDSLVGLDSATVGAHAVLLRCRRFHLERDGLRIAVSDCEGPLDELGERACRSNGAVRIDQCARSNRVRICKGNTTSEGPLMPASGRAVRLSRLSERHVRWKPSCELGSSSTDMVYWIERWVWKASLAAVLSRVLQL